MLLDQEGMQIANKRVDAEATGRERAFADKMARARQDAVMRGQGTSGALFQTIADLCAEEVETRADWIWKILRSLIPAAGYKVSTEDVDQLKRQLDELLVPYCYDRPEKEFHKAIEELHIPSAAARTAGFYDRREAARILIWAQIDQHAREIRSRAASEPKRLGVCEYWWMVLKRAWGESEFGRPWKFAAGGLAGVAYLCFEYWFGVQTRHVTMLSVLAVLAGYALVNLIDLVIRVFSIPPTMQGRGG